MTIVCGIDVETTGTDPERDEITELAYVIKRWGDPKPFCMQSYLCKVEAPISQEVIQLTGITQEHVDRGLCVSVAIDTLFSDCVAHGVDFFMAHNAQFDRAFVTKSLDKLDMSMKTPWLCTMTDIDWPDHYSRKLTYLAADHGFLNPFPHAALFDVMTMFNVAENFPLEKIIERGASPSITVKANVTFDEKELAKERRYRWEKLDNIHYPRSWVKKIKMLDLERERREAPFVVEVLNG